MLIPITAIMVWAGHQFETLCLLISAVLALVAIFIPHARTTLTTIISLLLLSLVLTLGIHLISDDFHYRYVWLYSATELSPMLKFTNIWGGEEGTLLFAAALFGLCAIALKRYGNWSVIGQLVFLSFFAFAAFSWNPFLVTPTEAASGRGMNVHLMKIWMTLHPPLIFIAYALLLMPTGAALQMLINGKGDWREITHRYARIGWWMLSVGIGVGMWWAFEDFTFGQVWHWDPVQTSVFVVWALFTAILHGIRYFRPDQLFARSLPLLSLLCAAAVFASMAITRNQWLASSHRYIGDTSAPWLSAMAVALLLLTLAAWIASLKRTIIKPSTNEPIWMIRIAISIFTAMAVIASIALGIALLNAYWATPRPESTKPFLETLLRWSSADEIEAIQQVFSRWDVDNFALNRWLTPLTAIAMLLGGHTFLKLQNRKLGWIITVGIAVLAFAIARWWNPLDNFYQGTGMTSQQTVQNFWWLNILLVCATYLLLTAISWSVRGIVNAKTMQNKIYRLCVGSVHTGAVVALIAIISASVLDSYVQSVFKYPQDFNTAKKLADGYSVEFSLSQVSLGKDGGRQSSDQVFRAISHVALKLNQADAPLDVQNGQVLYRHEQAPVEGDIGPVRQLCQVLDYRYARYVSNPSYILDPFIHHDIWRDTQVWMSPTFLANDLSEDSHSTPVQATVVIRSFPLLSWLWLGLAMILIATLILSIQSWKERARSGGISQ